MKRFKQILSTKVLPTILIMVLIFQLMPMPEGIVYAVDTQEITDVIVTPVAVFCDGYEHDAVTIEGLQENDVVTYQTDGGAWQSSVPTMKEIGEYSISVKVERTGFTPYETTVEAKIKANIIENVLVQPYVASFDGNNHDAVTVSGLWEGDAVEYQLDAGAWTTQVPEIQAIGTYTVNVKIAREKYETKVITVEAIVEKANPMLSFCNYTGVGGSDVVTGNFSAKEYDFSAKVDDSVTGGGTITYSISLSQDDTGIATIDAKTGKLTVTDAGVITIMATVSETADYKSTTVTYNLAVVFEANADGQFVSFPSATIDYVLGENSGVAGNQTATKKYRRDKGKITYSIDKEDIGLNCNEDSGKITVSDYQKLSDTLAEHNGMTIVTVTANKRATGRYGQDSVSYALSISFLNTPVNPYTVTGTLGENNWYIQDVTLTPKDTTYQIAKECNTSSFGSNVIVSDEDKGYVYLQSSVTGGITGPISYENIKIDTTLPVMSDISYNEAQLVKEEMHYYKEDIEVVFSVTEKNFLEDSMKVMLKKNDGTPYEALVEWREDENDTNKHWGNFVIPMLSNYQSDGKYVYTITGKDEAGNQAVEYASENLVIDTRPPIVKLDYANKNSANSKVDEDGKVREYFKEEQTVTLTVQDDFLDIQDTTINVFAKDMAGNTMNTANIVKETEWTQTKNVYTKVLSFVGEANYEIELTSTDCTGNTYHLEKNNCFTIDKSAPVNLSIKYSTGILELVLEAVSFGFYNAKTIVTVTAEDNISGISSISYSYTLAANAGGTNAPSGGQTVTAAGIEYSNNRKTATVKFEVPGGGSEFNGTIQFTATDYAGNSSSMRGAKRLVVDTISPTMEVSYNSPVQNIDDISYYDDTIVATLNIRENNFFSEDVKVMVSKDGGIPYVVMPQWNSNSSGYHIGTITLTEDGRYQMTIDYTDKSQNQMPTYTSEWLVLDTTIQEPIITINGEDANHKAYKEEVIPTVSFEDENFESYQVKLIRTRYGEKNVDVTEQFVGEHMSISSTGGSGTFDEFEQLFENDGIYTLSVTMRDKAGHESYGERTFTVNRFGSVYEYSDYLVQIIKEGSNYVQGITEDLIATEYNADRLLSDSVYIEITRDGRPLENVLYQITPTVLEENTIGSSGWYQYEYTIDKQNFISDGVYKIAISSKDATGNTPENNNYEDKNIVFMVDNTAPEITSIVGLENAIINAQEVIVQYEVYDTIGLKSVSIYVDGVLQGDVITDFGVDRNNYVGSFVLQENKKAQKIQIVVEDLAGNQMDTNSEKFTSAYAFSPSVTVSTNVLVRFTANKPLFYGSIATLVVVAFLSVGATVLVRQRRNM